MSVSIQLLEIAQVADEHVSLFTTVSFFSICIMLILMLISYSNYPCRSLSSSRSTSSKSSTPTTCMLFTLQDWRLILLQVPMYDSFFSCRWVNLQAIKRLVDADALQMEIIPNPKVMPMPKTIAHHVGYT